MLRPMCSNPAVKFVVIRRLFSAQRIVAGIVLLGLTLTLAAGAAAPGRDQQQEAAVATPKISANALVAEVVHNELNAKSSAKFMFRNSKQTPEGSTVKEMIQTQDGVVARTVALNGKPLTPEQRAEDDKKLQDLLTDPSKMAAKRKEQKADDERVSKMFGELPKAFLFEYDGTEQGKSGPLVRLKFQPNPAYQPSSHETSVYKAMSGTMLVDDSAKRLARIEATLFKEVSFGWGILGHLDKGGHFIVEQSKLAPDDWEPTSMNIQFTGKALFFHTINMHEIENNSDYQRVPDNLTLAQGIDMLKKAPDQMAENRGDK
jgi:hypothetical protein